MKNDQQDQQLQEIEKLIQHYMPCTCDVAYTSRKLTAPDCAFCNYGETLAEQMQEWHIKQAQPEQHPTYEQLEQEAKEYANRMVGNKTDANKDAWLHLCTGYRMAALKYAVPQAQPLTEQQAAAPVITLEAVESMVNLCQYDKETHKQVSKILHSALNKAALLDRNTPTEQKPAKHCPHCQSTDLIMFDSDNDLCQSCGKWFPAV